MSDSMEFLVSEAWREAYPGAKIGILALENVTNPNNHPELDQQKQELERELRRSFGESDRVTLRAQPTLQAYHNFYKRFKKSYHVQLQLESLLFKNKSIPRVACLVEAMFMAELKNQLLTAGHDLATVERPFGVRVAQGDEEYVRLNGQKQRLKSGDMFIADSAGVMSSVIYGPDRRTQIKSSTTEVVFTVYAPAGISLETVADHLEDIKNYTLLFSPDARIVSQRVDE